MFDSLGSAISYPQDVSRGIMPGGGKAFYVSSLAAHVGLDTNEGTDPNFPLLTINAAVGKCSQRRHDYIFVQDSYQADVTSILIDVRNVHLIGLSEGNPLGGRALIDMQGVDACITTYGTGGSLELAGFRLGSSGDPCIKLAESSYYNHIHHCAFAQYMAGTDGIFSGVGISATAWLIDHNIFSTQLTRDGIRLADDAWTIIAHNIFAGVAGIGINVTGSFGQIMGNVFFSLITDALAEGWAISLGGGTNGKMICGNKASACGDATGNNPYRDISNTAVGTLLNGWADNFDGPALSGGPGPND